MVYFSIEIKNVLYLKKGGTFFFTGCIWDNYLQMSDLQIKMYFYHVP